MKGTMASVNTFVWGKNCPSQDCPDARQFSSSLYIPGAFQAVATMLELRANETRLLCGGLFKRKGLGIQKPSISSNLNPYWFL